MAIFFSEFDILCEKTNEPKDCWKIAAYCPFHGYGIYFYGLCVSLGKSLAIWLFRTISLCPLAGQQEMFVYPKNTIFFL